MRRYILLILPVLLFARERGHSQSPIKSWDAPYLCNYSKVTGLGPAMRLHVRLGPSVRDRSVDTLVDGQIVYVCDSNLYWYKIVYGDSSGHCEQTSERGLDIRQTKDCKAGWVRKKWIDILSG